MLVILLSSDAGDITTPRLRPRLSPFLLVVESVAIFVKKTTQLQNLVLEDLANK